MSETLSLLQTLICKQSVTPIDAGCQHYLADRLKPSGFVAEYLNFSDTENIWLRRGQHEPLFTFLGHTDVVPPGALTDWATDPFVPSIRDGKLYGRGAADMKGSIAAFVTAVERFVSKYPDHQGSIAILLTSDEEGIATHGVVKVVDVLEQRQEKIDWCLVGEPSSTAKLGDVIRVGRRGSLCGQLTIFGVQGHVAYPDRAENPIHTFAPALTALTQEVWDQGNAFFPASRLQVSNIKAGTGAENIIPGRLDVQFNLRFNTELSQTSIENRVNAILTHFGLKYELTWRLSGLPFLTTQGQLTTATQAAIKQVCGYETVCDTGGGTSDGRFIAPTGAQVIELGPINASIHKIDEHIDLLELEQLSCLYEQILVNLLVAA